MTASQRGEREASTSVRPQPPPKRSEAISGGGLDEKMTIGDGVREWCILRAGYGRREVFVAGLLERLGFATWYPTTRVPVRARRYCRPNMVRMPIIPPYLFVGFVDGGPGWYEISMHSEHFGAVIYRGERPFALSPGEFTSLRAKFLKERRKAMRHAREERQRKILKTGERATITVGPLFGESLQLRTIDGDIATGLMQVLGAERLVQVPLDALARAA